MASLSGHEEFYDGCMVRCPINCPIYVPLMSHFRLKPSPLMLILQLDGNGLELTLILVWTNHYTASLDV